jgi:DNA-binding NarL/FixJ family response regulator
MLKRWPMLGKALSDRELQVVRLVAIGMSNSDIAIKLHLTEDTIKSHLQRVFHKMGVHNRTTMTWRLLEQEVLTPEQWLDDFHRLKGAPLSPPVQRLTEAEMRVFTHLCTGLSNREIAEKVGSSAHTVKSQLSDIADKLHVSGREAMAATGFVFGLTTSLSSGDNQ